MATNDRVSCSACKSTFFIQSRAEQFQQGGYGTAEFRSLSNAPKTILICVGCGTPLSPKASHYGKGTVADLAENDFRASIEAGQKYRKETAMSAVSLATIHTEINEVRGIVESVKTAVTALGKPKVPKPKQEALHAS